MAKIADVQEVSLEKLRPYERNAKKHGPGQIEKLKASIMEFGFLTPCLIDSDYNLIAGHGRVMAAKELGIKTVPCVFIEGLTDEQRRAYILADNRLGELGEWDIDLVVGELIELDELGFDVELTGFDMPEELPEVIEDDFDESTIPDEPRTKFGDIWQLGDHRLICGDSTDPAVIDRLMDGVKADMVFTDPPYGVDYEGINNDSRNGLEGLLFSAFQNAKGNCKNGSAVYCFHSDKCADIFHDVFRKFCHFSSMIIWEKESLVLSHGDYQSIHEPCLYGWFDNGTHKFYGDRKQTSVWKFERKSVEGHTTPKPIGFICKALENSSTDGEIVFDPFGGSGSTLIACEQLKRKCYMCELDPHYCDVIINRWETLTGRKAVLIDG